MARKNNIYPLIKHCVFSSLQKAWNARLDTALYGQRSQSETVNSRLKRTDGAFVRSRRWWKQFRELALAYIVYNLDRALQRSVQTKQLLVVLTEVAGGETARWIILSDTHTSAIDEDG
jgi:IS5 family transposase